MYARIEELCVLLKSLVPEWDLTCMEYNSKIVKNKTLSIPREIERNTIRIGVYSTTCVQLLTLTFALLTSNILYKLEGSERGLWWTASRLTSSLVLRLGSRVDS